jgi:hypothetical protein
MLKLINKFLIDKTCFPAPIYAIKILHVTTPDIFQIRFIKTGTQKVDSYRKNLQNLNSYRVQSPLFNVTFADHNIFGAPAGITQWKERDS